LVGIPAEGIVYGVGRDAPDRDVRAVEPDTLVGVEYFRTEAVVPVGTDRDPEPDQDPLDHEAERGHISVLRREIVDRRFEAIVVFTWFVSEPGFGEADLGADGTTGAVRILEMGDPAPGNDVGVAVEPGRQVQLQILELLGRADVSFARVIHGLETQIRHQIRMSPRLGDRVAERIDVFGREAGDPERRACRRRHREAHHRRRDQGLGG
jgi:hypothetical protein